MQETWVQFLGWEDPLEKEMAIHSSILAWKIPWTGVARVGHSLATKPPPVKNLPANAVDSVQSMGQEGSTGEGNSNPLQCSCLENPTDRGAWWVTVLGAKSWT